MDNRFGLITIGVLVLLFAFTFVFGWDSLMLPNLLYGILAVVGYVVCISFALFLGVMTGKQGEAIAVWYYGYAIVISIIFVWYLTRCGTAFQLWT
jgi:hypothetical protein